MSEPPTPAADGDAAESLTSEEVRARATGGAAVLGARGVLVYALGIVANLVLASLLAPRDFGLFAVGLVIVVLGTYLAEGGFGAALIRREQAPERRELEAVLGVQLALTVGLALVAAAIGLALGRDGLVVATMAASLPLFVLRTPSVVVLERRLRYRAIATGDVVEALAYNAWSVGAVVLGFGVWGLATAVVVRAVTGSAVIVALGPVGAIRPRWSWATVRPFWGFGLRFQLAEALYIAREQGLSVVVGAVGGLGVLGIWNLAWRVMQVPNLLFITVGRVAFPAVSRLVGAGEDVRGAIERGAAVLAAATGLLIAAVVGASVALPAIVGDEWGDVPETILWSGVGLIVASPIAVATRGYLFAVGRAGTVSAGLVASAAVWFALSAALLPELGAVGVGIGWVAAGLVNAVVLWRVTVRLTGAALMARLAAPTLVALAGTAAAWLVANEPSEPAVGAALGVLAGVVVVLSGLAVVARSSLGDVRGLAGQALRSLRPGA